jgi:hypothetical protein
MAAEARQYQLSANSIRSDAVTYTHDATLANLTQAANCFILLVGKNVSKSRPLEILDTAEWLMTVASAGQDTARFPRPAAIGGVFLKSKLIATAVGAKNVATLVNAADMSTDPLSDADAVYYGVTGAAASGTDLAIGVQMGSGALERAFEEIKQYYIQSVGASNAT